MKNNIFLSFFLLFIVFSCSKKEELRCKNFQDMYASLPKDITLDTLQLKGKIVCNYKIKYVLTNAKESVDLIVNMFDEDTDFRLKEYKKTLSNISKKNGIPEKELLYGIMYQTTNFSKTVRSIIKSAEEKEEYTSFIQTKHYKVGFSQNRMDALIKNRYCLTIFLHSAKKMNHNDFKDFILPYFNKFDFKNL